jgi:DNA uptake protein ComE-like DNA-binding protein
MPRIGWPARPEAREAGNDRPPAGRAEEAKLIMNRVAHRMDSQRRDPGGGARAESPAPNVARRRVFLALERKRELLAVGTRRQLRPGKRYEDLCLAKLITRLQRDYLSPRSADGPRGSRPLTRGTGSAAPTAPARAEGEVVAWAMPWGPGCLVQLQSDQHDFNERSATARRWLSTGGQAAAEARAVERFARFVEQMADALEAAGLGVPEWASRGALTQRRRAIRRRPEKPAGRRRTARQRRSHGSSSDRASAGHAAAPTRNQSRTTPNGLIDINQATYEELRSLELSTTQSRRLLAYRRRVQGFGSLNELDAIPGFPSVVLNQLKQRLSA